MIFHIDVAKVLSEIIKYVKDLRGENEKKSYLVCVQSISRIDFGYPILGYAS